MLHKISNNIISYASSIILGCICFLLLVYPDFFANEKTNNYSLLNYSNELSLFWNAIVFIFISIIVLGIVKAINSSYKFIEGSIIPMVFFYLVAVLSLPSYLVSMQCSIGFVFVLLSLLSILKIHSQPIIRLELFLSGLFIGFASLFFYPLMLFLLMVFAAITIFRPFGLRNYLMPIIGLILPLIYWYGTFYLFDLPIQLSEKELKIEQVHSFQFTFNWIPTLAIIILGSLGGLSIFLSNTKFIVRQRNQLAVILFYLFISFVVLFFTTLSQLSLAVLPILSFFFLYFYQKVNKKWIIDSLLLIILFSSIWLKLYV